MIPETHPLPQSVAADNGLGGEIYINKYDAEIVETEIGSGYVQNMTHPKMPIIINEDETNKWGSPRGYKVRMAVDFPASVPVTCLLQWAKEDKF